MIKPRDVESNHKHMDFPGRKKRSRVKKMWLYDVTRRQEAVKLFKLKKEMRTCS